MPTGGAANFPAPLPAPKKKIGAPHKTADSLQGEVGAALKETSTISYMTELSTRVHFDPCMQLPDIHIKLQLPLWGGGGAP